MCAVAMRGNLWGRKGASPSRRRCVVVASFQKAPKPNSEAALGGDRDVFLGLRPWAVEKYEKRMHDRAFSRRSRSSSGG